MTKLAALYLTLGLSACAAPSAPQPQDDAELRRRIDELSRQLESARHEIFALRLRQARLDGKPDEEARVLREDGLGSPHEAIRLAALREIAALAPDRLKAFAEPLSVCARAGTVAVRCESVRLLGRVPAAEAAVIEAARDAAPEVRRAAAAALRSGSAASVDALAALLSDHAKDVRLAALDSAGAVRSDRAVAAVVRATEDADAAVVERAVDVLGTLASPAAAGPLQRVLASASTDAIRWSAVNALGKIGAPESAPAIRPYLDAARPSNLREVAAQALGRLRDAGGVPALAAALAGDVEPRVREAAARSLGQIGGPAARDALVPAALDAPDASVRRAAWEGALAAAGGRFADLQHLWGVMRARKRRDEVEAVCQRLHALKLEGDERERHLKLEEDAAEFALEAKDFRAALGHLAVLRGAAAPRPELLRRIARCHSLLGEHDAAYKALAEALAHCPESTPPWWEVKLEQLASLEAAGAHVRVLEESAAAANGKAPPDAAKAVLDATRGRAAAALVQSLASNDAAARKRAVEAVKPLGKRIILALADAVVDESLADRSAVVEAGNAITGGTLADLAKAAEIAAAWRAWAAKP